MKTRLRIFENKKHNFSSKYQSDDLDSQCMETKEESEMSTEESPIHESCAKKIRRKRNRKSDYQVNILKAHFDMNTNWTKEQVVELAKQAGLSEAQVYKWGWDYKKKLRLEGKCENDINLQCEETLAPSVLDYELYLVQKDYRRSVTSWNFGSSIGLFSSPYSLLA
ncbi:unnamed protein product [Blepharisma stoltei]|uniref:Homeobox domain-containing protein n=1 Tax=Blepharisma stoltei TaxID=1481888 RepID=A0AAU9K855_9CILI|nr:unnamed protein product [Blepharisma stoltei]